MSPQVEEIMSKISALNYFSILNDDQKVHEKWNELINVMEELTSATSVKSGPKVQIEGGDVLVPYMTVTKFFKITVAQYDLIKNLYPENKISIIKWLRAEYKQGLKETKDICDSICGLN